ncbi:hypothetical protein TWF281_002847 [Arthrobotrys megalospora]
MEVHHPPPPPLPAISSSPRFTPIAIAPKPIFNPLPISLISPPTTIMNPITTIPQTPTRELWTDPEKYDLLWSIIRSTGLTAQTIPWHSISLPSNHTQASAQVVVQDIALGKHHITHPTFTPSNKAGVIMLASRDTHLKKAESTVRGSSKKRKLDIKPDEEEEREQEREREQEQEEQKEEDTDQKDISDSPHQRHPTSSPPTSSTPSSPNHITSETPDRPKKSTPSRRRHKSDSPPIELDLSNPRITSYLKAEGYMNEDGTPVKKKRGRPTKDPFGLSVTLKKQLMRMDPNAPPMKKRGRPRKRFLDIDGYSNGNSRDMTAGGALGEEESISPALRLAIEKIGEEMDRDVEALLDEGRSMRDTEDDDESEGYDGEVAEVWEGDETEDEDEGNVREKEAEGVVVESRPGRMMVDKKDEIVTLARVGESGVVRRDESVSTRQVEKMAVDNLVEKPGSEVVWFGST